MAGFHQSLEVAKVEGVSDGDPAQVVDDRSAHNPEDENN